jgi:hypothetical protein
MENHIQTLGDILRGIEKIEKGGNALYLVRDETEFVETSPCAILNPDDSADPGVIDPDFAVNNNLKFALFIDDVESIVSNAKQQIENPTIENLLEAFNYYMEYDAFIRF